MSVDMEDEIERLLARAKGERQAELLESACVRAIIRLVERRRTGVTFMEVENLAYDLGLEVNGRFALLPDDVDHGLCVWAAMSEAFARVMRKVASTGRVVYKPAPFATYRAVRAIIGLPMVSEVRDYDQLSWLPVTLWPVEVIDTDAIS